MPSDTADTQERTTHADANPTAPLRIWKIVQRPGAYAYPVLKDGKITNRLAYFSPNKNSRYAKTVKDMLADGITIPIIPEHHAGAVPLTRTEHEKKLLADTVGFVRDARVGAGGTLELLHEIVDPAWAEKIGVTVLDCSPGFRDWYKTGDGKLWYDVVAHVALTNHPVDHKKPKFDRSGVAANRSEILTTNDAGLSDGPTTFMSLAAIGNGTGSTPSPSVVPIWEIDIDHAKQCLRKSGTSWVFHHVDGKERFGTKSGAFAWLEQQYAKQFSQDGAAGDGAIWMAVMRAPIGGVNISGRFYRGGQFIPNEVLKNASPEDRQKVMKARSDYETKRASDAKGHMQDAESVHHAIIRHAGEHGHLEQSPSDKRHTIRRWAALKNEHGEKGALERVVILAATEAKKLQDMAKSQVPGTDGTDSTMGHWYKRRLAAYAQMVGFALNPESIAEYKSGIGGKGQEKGEGAKEKTISSGVKQAETMSAAARTTTSKDAERGGTPSSEQALAQAKVQQKQKQLTPAEIGQRMRDRQVLNEKARAVGMEDDDKSAVARIGDDDDYKSGVANARDVMGEDHKEQSFWVPRTPDSRDGKQKAAMEAAHGDSGFMKPQQSSGPHSADHIDSYAGQSFTSDRGHTVDVRKAEDGTWTVGTKTGLTKQGVANHLNAIGAQKAQGLFKDEVTAQAPMEKKKEQLQWADTGKPNGGGAGGTQSDETALPGMRDTFAPGMFGKSRTEREVAEKTESETPDGNDSKTMKVALGETPGSHDNQRTTPQHGEAESPGENVTAKTTGEQADAPAGPPQWHRHESLHQHLKSLGATGETIKAVKQRAHELHRVAKEEADRFNRALKDARQRTVHNDQEMDYTGLKAHDTTTTAIDSEHPGFLQGDWKEKTEQLWGHLKGGFKSVPGLREFEEQALEEFHSGGGVAAQAEKKKPGRKGASEDNPVINEKKLKKDAMDFDPSTFSDDDTSKSQEQPEEVAKEKDNAPSHQLNDPGSGKGDHQNENASIGDSVPPVRAGGGETGDGKGFGDEGKGEEKGSGKGKKVAQNPQQAITTLHNLYQSATTIPAGKFKETADQQADIANSLSKSDVLQLLGKIGHNHPALKNKSKQQLLAQFWDSVKTRHGQNLRAQMVYRPEELVSGKSAEKQSPLQSHEMTSLEYAKSKLPASVRDKVQDAGAGYKAQHKKEVQAALERGETVPEHVLAEYGLGVGEGDVEKRAHANYDVEHQRISGERAIVPIHETEYEDGSWRGVGDVPWSTKPTGKTRIAGYGGQNKNTGTKFGKRFATREEAEAHYEAADKANRQKYVDAYKAMTPERQALQDVFWQEQALSQRFRNKEINADEFQKEKEKIAAKAKPLRDAEEKRLMNAEAAKGDDDSGSGNDKSKSNLQTALGEPPAKQDAQPQPQSQSQPSKPVTSDKLSKLHAEREKYIQQAEEAERQGRSGTPFRDAAARVENRIKNESGDKYQPKETEIKSPTTPVATKSEPPADKQPEAKQPEAKKPEAKKPAEISKDVHLPAEDHSAANAGETLRAAEIMESAKKDATPREVASAVKKATDPAYAYARASSVSNAGEDLLHSKRHLANAWRGLEEAEADGSAERLVNRDKLLENEPHNLMTHADTNPFGAVAMHFAMKAFPPQPNHNRGASTDTKKKDRGEYLQAYRDYKKKAEEIAKEVTDPSDALHKMKDYVLEMIKSYRGQKSLDAVGQATAADRYNPTANALVKTYQSLRGGASRFVHDSSLSKTSARGQLFQFLGHLKGHLKTDPTGAAFEFKSSDEKAQLMDNVKRFAKNVLDGASIGKAFGVAAEKGEKQKRFNPTEMYITDKVVREGGRSVPQGQEKLKDHFLKTSGFRGLQFGNYVSDDERIHHLGKMAEAMVDLADVTGLPDSAMSLEGKLGLSFGARGGGTAHAHYEPSEKVINLTRTKGAGTVAHEWGHALDHYIAGGDLSRGMGGKREANYKSNEISSDRFDRETGKITSHADDPIWKAMDKVRKAWKESGFDAQLKEALREIVRAEGMSRGKATDYWASNHEKFARTFEKWVQHELRSQKRDNTYLSGLAEESVGERPEPTGSKIYDAHQTIKWFGRKLWPSAEQAEKMAPAFRELLKVIKEKHFSSDAQVKEMSITRALPRDVRIRQMVAAAAMEIALGLAV